MMRIRFGLLFLCFFVMALLPFLSVSSVVSSEGEESRAEESITEESKAKASRTEGSKTEEKQEAVFRILDTSSGKVAVIPEKEFCIGALAYEMLPSFEEEALKAQTVALYSFFCRKRALQRAQPDQTLKGADFSANLTKGECYLNENQLKEKWGKDYESCRQKLTAAVEAVEGIMMTEKDGHPIDACYHAISGGMTENAEDIFGRKDIHLLAAASPYDAAAPGYLSEVTVTKEEFCSRLQKAHGEIQFSSEPEKDIAEPERTPSGSVMRQKIGGVSLAGTEIRQLFGLRSAVYELSYGEGAFHFFVRGYGHGVGMSQWGAQGMAQQGSSYEEILKHYYSEIVLRKQDK